MKFCTKCGYQLPDDAICCSQCGNMLNSANPQPQAAPAQTYTANSAPSGKLNVGMLVWAIINSLFCCLPLGIVALVYSIKTGSSTTVEEENDCGKKAKVWNIVATVAGAVFMIAWVILIIIMISTGDYQGNYTEYVW